MVLIIVRRGATEKYRFLHETFAGQPVSIVWDRRLGDRRQDGARLALERRRRERRHWPPRRWGTLDFVAVPVSGRWATALTN